MKRFVISDSHGAYKALVQCLVRCGFNNREDQLYFLGDIVDGWSETKESIDLLLGIRNLVHLLGNHDQWAIKAYTGELFKPAPKNRQELELWILQGGAATVKSFGIETGIPNAHLEFLLQARPYYITEDNILMVHAGFNPNYPIADTNTDYLIWNRDFITNILTQYIQSTTTQTKPTQVKGYKEIYVGHTPTINYDPKQTLPLQMGNVILIDTGAAFDGYLSIMDIDSKQVWQSDKVRTLYPDEEGRNGMSWNQMQQH